MSYDDPIEPSEPDLDDLTRAELAEYDRQAADVAMVLDDLRHRAHGIVSSAHHVGLFLGLLAAAGYRVEPIVVPDLAGLLPPAVD